MRLLVLSCVLLFSAGFSNQVNAQQKTIEGMVTDTQKIPLPGVTVIVKGTTQGTITNTDGSFSLTNIPKNTTLIFSFIGMKTEEIIIGNQTSILVRMEEESISLEEVVAIGYGSQKRSNITGSIASVSKERLEIVPNLNVAQAIQGSMAGVIVNQAQAGAVSNESIMIRGRNSILASNDPLVVVDGVTYYGNIQDINVNDIESIDILKDASAAAIYGSRGSNGVILISTKEGVEGKPVFDYEGKFGFQNFINIPDYMSDGERFYIFKETRDPGKITASEQAVYNTGNWVDWPSLALRKGYSHQHNLSVSGGTSNTKYYIGGSFLDIQGVTINDDYERITNRINIDTKVTDWLSLGTRTQLSFNDMSGVSPNLGQVYQYNPLTTAYDDNGELMIYPWPEYPDRPNRLSPVLYDDTDKSSQVITNNYAIVTIPFIKGLSYRLNSGYHRDVIDKKTYMKRNTSVGLEAGGRSEIERTISSNLVIENILSYNRIFDQHNLFFTGLYSYEENNLSTNALTASRFTHDYITNYSIAQAENIIPSFLYNNDVLISQMLRLNYDYAESRYLLTLTGRRDGYSGFGENNKWGFFPSVAVGWNITQENFFPANSIFEQFKLRFSYGTNGNQAVGAFESITRLREQNMVSGNNTQPGYVPDKLGDRELGWETTKSLNFGLDFRMLNGKINGDINYFHSNTYDLLLNRTISLVHGISSITQNIGKTKNKGLEVSIESRNISSPDLNWITNVNFTFLRNEIVSLYGYLDSAGNEVDDVANSWFIGQPILVNYDYKVIGVWQLSEVEEAAKWGSQPGFVKLEDVNGDGFMTADEDRQIQGQRDPKMIWGLNNSLSFKNLTLSVFMHGVHGVTKFNAMKQDTGVGSETRGTTIVKNWWTPDNPTNEYYMNALHAHTMGGAGANYYEDASFIRLKDVSLSYNIPQSILNTAGLQKLRIFTTVRNLATFSSWKDGDPELDQGRGDFPLNREFVFGINLGF
ncbi:MAG: TonB-dependent receptor [Parabacteroides sp.]|nr:TonB-dependent receptor [Parabacteroides sp.]